MDQVNIRPDPQPSCSQSSSWQYVFELETWIGLWYDYDITYYIWYWISVKYSSCEEIGNAPFAFYYLEYGILGILTQANVYLKPNLDRESTLYNAWSRAYITRHRPLLTSRGIFLSGFGLYLRKSGNFLFWMSLWNLFPVFIF